MVDSINKLLLIEWLLTARHCATLVDIAGGRDSKQVIGEVL